MLSFIKSYRHAAPVATLLVFILAGILPGQVALCATNFFVPVADTSLLEVATSNNMGGFAGMNSGTTGEYKKTRALIRFDLTPLPRSTIVQFSALHIDVTHQPSADESPPPITFGLRRMLRSWGEGTNSPTTQIGKGLPATEGDATWFHAFFPTNLWTSPGGAVGEDFSDTESTFTDIIGVSSYTFPSTPEMVGDVTGWLDHPQNNFGWVLLCNSEGANYSARRFSTREDVDHLPLLELHYLVPPQMTIAKTNSTQTCIQFTAWAGHTYDIEYRNSPAAGSWALLSHLDAAPTNYPVTLLDTQSVTQRFYRVNAY